MKIQLKIVSFFVLAIVCLAACCIYLASQNQNEKSENTYEFKQENKSISNVDEMIEKVKAPAYYTVFNIIINYLPLNK